MPTKGRRYPYEPDPENPRRPNDLGGPYNEPGAESGEGTPYIEGGGKQPEKGQSKDGGPFLEPGADPGPEQV